MPKTLRHVEKFLEVPGEIAQEGKKTKFTLPDRVATQAFNNAIFANGLESNLTEEERRRDAAGQQIHDARPPPDAPLQDVHRILNPPFQHHFVLQIQQSLSA